MKQQERLKDIRISLMSNESISVNDLSNKYSVTTETIRRDLKKLEAEGVLSRTYGGAIINETDNSSRIRFNTRMQVHTAEKELVASLAYSLIPDSHLVIGADSSSSSYALINMLLKKNLLSLVTYSAYVLQHCVNSNLSIICPGGNLNKSTMSFEGVITRKTLRSFNYDINIFSCKGMSLNGGCFDSDDEEIELKQIMINNSNKNVLLVDDSKFNKSAFAKLASFDDIDILVTNKEPSREWTELLIEHNVKIIYPGSNN